MKAKDILRHTSCILHTEIILSTVYLALGSNLGDREANLKKALELIRAKGIEIRAVSGVYETEPVYVKGQPDFYNACVEVKTGLKPGELLEAIKSIEKAMGREKTREKGPRIIDIDILLCGNIIQKDKGLIIPHPGIRERRFVLGPLAEIAAGAVHPESKITVKEMLEKGVFSEKCVKTGVKLV